MPFDNLMTDKITIIKQDGSRFDDIKASVQKNKIFIQSTKYLIEPRDIIQRKMSNGGEETYEVIDPGFHEQFHGIPAGYQMDVRKLGLPEARNAIQNITYNITGQNARINQNSIDRSINIIQLNPDVAENIDALRQEVNRIIRDEVARTAAHEVVDAIEEQFKSGTPKISVVSALLKGLPAAGSIASIGSFLLSCLR